MLSLIKKWLWRLILVAMAIIVGLHTIEGSSFNCILIPESVAGILIASIVLSYTQNQGPIIYYLWVNRQLHKVADWLKREGIIRIRGSTVYNISLTRGYSSQANDFLGQCQG